MNIIGIDVSKDTLDNYLDKNEKYSEHIKVANDVSGCLKLHEWIKQHKIRKLAIVMEATGIYYKLVADYFADFYDVYVINPLKIKKYAESELSRTKTDKADSKLICDYGKRNLDKLHKYVKQQDNHEELQNLIALYRQLKMQITQNKNRLDIAKDEYIRSILLYLTETLSQKSKEILARIDKLLLKSKHKQQYLNLQTISGISKITAATILNYLLTKQFANANKFIAFAGLSPQIAESGVSVKKPDRMTHYGHRRLKSIFYMPALAAYRSGVFKDFVARLLGKGKSKKLVIVALMRKLAKIAYCVFKSNKPFSLENKKICNKIN